MSEPSVLKSTSRLAKNLDTADKIIETVEEESDETHETESEPEEYTTE